MVLCQLGGSKSNSKHYEIRNWISFSSVLNFLIPYDILFITFILLLFPSTKPLFRPYFTEFSISFCQFLKVDAKYKLSLISDLFLFLLWDWFHIYFSFKNGCFFLSPWFLLVFQAFLCLFFIFVYVFLCGIVLTSWLYYNHYILICKSVTSHKFFWPKLYIFHKNRHKKEANLFFPKRFAPVPQ